MEDPVPPLGHREARRLERQHSAPTNTTSVADNAESTSAARFSILFLYTRRLRGERLAQHARQQYAHLAAQDLGLRALGKRRVHQPHSLKHLEEETHVEVEIRRPGGELRKEPLSQWRITRVEGARLGPHRPAHVRLVRRRHPQLQHRFELARTKGGPHQVDHRHDPCVPLRKRLEPGDDAIAKPRIHRLECRTQQNFALSKVMQQRPVRDARALADRERGGADVALLDQALDRRFDQLGARLSRALRLGAPTASGQGLPGRSGGGGGHDR